MAYTKSQQTRLDAAQQRLDTAKDSYAEAVRQFNNNAANVIPCYTEETFYGVASAETGAWNPNRTKCTREGACNNASKNQCQNFVDQLNSTFIPALRNWYLERNDAQTNYDKVFDEIAAEIKADPDFIHTQTGIQAEAAASAQYKKYMYIFLAIGVIVIAFLIFAWWKWFRK